MVWRLLWACAMPPPSVHLDQGNLDIAQRMIKSAIGPDANGWPEPTQEIAVILRRQLRNFHPDDLLELRRHLNGEAASLENTDVLLTHYRGMGLSDLRIHENIVGDLKHAQNLRLAIGALDDAIGR